MTKLLECHHEWSYVASRQTLLRTVMCGMGFEPLYAMRTIHLRTQFGDFAKCNRNIIKAQKPLMRPIM